MSDSIESSRTLQLDFKKLSAIGALHLEVIPVVIQHVDTLDVLILGYVNELALSKSISTKKVTLWSTSRNELWVKGETSGDYLDLVEVRVNCEQNSLLFLVRPRTGGVCHTLNPKTGAHRPSCYYRIVNGTDLIKVD